MEKFRTWSDCDGDVETALYQRSVADQHHHLLVDAEHQFVDAPVLRAAAQSFQTRHRTRHRGSHGRGAVSQGNHVGTPLMSGARVQHQAMDRDACGRPFCRNGGAGGWPPKFARFFVGWDKKGPFASGLALVAG